MHTLRKIGKNENSLLYKPQFLEKVRAEGTSLAKKKRLPNYYNAPITCRAKINPTTQTIAVKVRFSLLMARAKEKSCGDGLE